LRAKHSIETQAAAWTRELTLVVTPMPTKEREKSENLGVDANLSRNSPDHSPNTFHLEGPWLSY